MSSNQNPGVPQGLAIERVAGRGVFIQGDDIDTDRIIPARFLRCVTFEGLEAHIFEDDRQQLQAAGRRHPLDDPRHDGAAILVVNRNFGCGSSREHAPQGLLRWGIRAIAGESFAEIFRGNCVALGIPCATLAPGDLVEIQSTIDREPSAELVLDLKKKTLRVTMPGAHREYAAALPEGARETFLGGTWDATGLLMRSPGEIQAVAARLPYTRAFA